MKSNITMRDIAQQLGVSSVTVSKALNDKDGVSEELRLKIKTVAAEMGYRIHSAAKSMKEGCSYNIGVIVAERFAGMGQSFYLQFFQHITKYLEEVHYSGILSLLSSEDEENLVLPRLYHERKADGFIVLGQLSKDYIDALLETGIPLVFLDFYTDQSEMDCVITDNFYGMYELTNYLIHEGHRDIAFVGNLHSTSSIQDRFLGYYKSLLEHRIDLRSEFIINDRDEKGQFVDMVLPDAVPTAFVCNCDQVAFNLMSVLRKRGLQVPEDCSVVGFDNDIYSTISEPALTTVAVDMEEMAKTAVKIVLEKIDQKNTSYGRVLVKGRIIYRDSVKINQSLAKSIDGTSLKT